MIKRTLFIISSLVLIGALLSACGSAPATATPEAEATPAKQVNLSTAAEGNLEPVQNVPLNFTGSGLVTEVNVKEGQAVKAGDVIARVKTDAQRDALSEAEAALAVAQADQAAYRCLPQPSPKRMGRAISRLAPLPAITSGDRRRGIGAGAGIAPTGETIEYLRELTAPAAKTGGSGSLT
jgi:multidrug efflux pump subunit AcrA (membrane-fusion protein)